MSSCGYCGDCIWSDGRCYACADDAIKRAEARGKARGKAEGREPIESIEEYAPGTPVRIVAKFRKSGEGFEDWPWLVNVNIGGWRRGRSVRCYGATMVEAIANAMEELAKPDLERPA